LGILWTWAEVNSRFSDASERDWQKVILAECAVEILAEGGFVSRARNGAIVSDEFDLFDGGRVVRHRMIPLKTSRLCGGNQDKGRFCESEIFRIFQRELGGLMWV